MATSSSAPPGVPAVGPVARADALGWLSAVLGAPLVVMPGRVLDTIGIESDGVSRVAARAVGAREFLATAQINGMRHHRFGAWARVAGDTMDLALLGTALVHQRRPARPLVGAIGVVGALFAADLITAVQFSRADGANVPDGAGSAGIGAPSHDSGARPAHLRAAVTIGKPLDEVRSEFERFPWTSLDVRQALDTGGVRFAPAPGERGTEVHVDIAVLGSGGPVAAAARKALGRSPAQTVTDELRRFKALLETGVIPSSDKTPAGPSTGGQIAQRPGQPQAVNT